MWQLSLDGGVGPEQRVCEAVEGGGERVEIGRGEGVAQAEDLAVVEHGKEVDTTLGDQVEDGRLGRTSVTEIGLAISGRGRVTDIGLAILGRARMTDIGLSLFGRPRPQAGVDEARLG